ncbi:hypothetical protein LEP1GSC037_4036 [Leptospira interrogans str. 2006001854]|uniref:Uncharacterized protein n=1 Tax=Leptospira interrogans str. 2006001854 TaxID=1001590 RepID=M6GGE1_LEPIR|nr:hypothetical protein LEP1GSC037_4036 [Leptospira interrogans str. 2006001854]
MFGTDPREKEESMLWFQLSRSKETLSLLFVFYFLFYL